VIGGLVRTSVTTRIVARVSVVGSWKVWMVVSTNEVAEMASMNQFFYLVLECFAFVCGMAIVTVIAVVFGHVGIGRIRCFARWWDEVSLKSFTKKAEGRDAQGCVSGEARLLGFSGSGVEP